MYIPYLTLYIGICKRNNAGVAYIEAEQRLTNLLNGDTE